VYVDGHGLRQAVAGLLLLLLLLLLLRGQGDIVAGIIAAVATAAAATETGTSAKAPSSWRKPATTSTASGHASTEAARRKSTERSEGVPPGEPREPARLSSGRDHCAINRCGNGSECRDRASGGKDSAVGRCRDNVAVFAAGRSQRPQVHAVKGRR